MMQVNLIWAQARQRVIGLNGKMPWHLPEDLAHFKQMTLGHPVIMGRKTWDSLPAAFKPLPGRVNVVISRQKNLLVPTSNNVFAVNSLAESLQICENLSTRPSEVWVIGGAQIYAQALPLAHRLEVTEIEETLEGDAFAPALGKEWRETARDIQRSKTGVMYCFTSYVRQ